MSPEAKKEYMRKYREKHRDKLKAQHTAWLKANPERVRKHNQDFYQAHKTKIDQRNKEWRTKNNYKVPYSPEREKRRVPTLQRRIAGILRSRIRLAIRNTQKKGSAVNDLGCTIAQFLLHISSKFQEGMSWDNYGEWHLDHIKPLASFDLSDRKQFIEACHYTNYQPLWALDNLKKGSKNGVLPAVEG